MAGYSLNFVLSEQTLVQQPFFSYQDEIIGANPSQGNALQIAAVQTAANGYQITLK
jgi:hypothetical protein